MNIDICLKSLPTEVSSATVKLLATSNSEQVLDELVDYIVSFESAEAFEEFDSRYDAKITIGNIEYTNGEFYVDSNYKEVFHDYQVWNKLLENPNLSKNAMLKIIDKFGPQQNAFSLCFRDDLDTTVVEKLLRCHKLDDLCIVGILINKYTVVDESIYEMLAKRIMEDQMTIFLDMYEDMPGGCALDLDVSKIISRCSVETRKNFLLWWDTNRNHLIVSSYHKSNCSLYYVVNLLRAAIKPFDTNHEYDLYEKDADALATHVMSRFAVSSDPGIYERKNLSADSDITWIASKCSSEKKKELLTWWENYKTTAKNAE